MRAKVLLDLVAKKLFLTKGMGVHEDKLTSFEYALRNAGIAGTNLVLISSNITQPARGNKDGKWTTTYAAAVLVHSLLPPFEINPNESYSDRYLFYDLSFGWAIPTEAVM